MTAKANDRGWRRCLTRNLMTAMALPCRGNPRFVWKDDALARRSVRSERTGIRFSEKSFSQLNCREANLASRGSSGRKAVMGQHQRSDRSTWTTKAAIPRQYHLRIPGGQGEPCRALGARTLEPAVGRVQVARQTGGGFIPSEPLKWVRPESDGIEEFKPGFTILR